MKYKYTGAPCFVGYCELSGKQDAFFEVCRSGCPGKSDWVCPFCREDLKPQFKGMFEED